MQTGIKKTSLGYGDVYTSICLASEDRIYSAYIRGKRCKTEDDFFREISAAFQFPYYFGENWAAMDECLCDLEWLKASQIFVVIDDFGSMFCDQAHIQNVLQERVIKYFGIMIDCWEAENIPVTVWLNN